MCTPLGVFYHILRRMAHYAGARWGSSCIMFCDQRPSFWLGDLRTNHPCPDPPVTIINTRFALLACQITPHRITRILGTTSQEGRQTSYQASKLN